MKTLRILILAVLIALFIPIMPTYAATEVSSHLEGGIANEVDYKEVTFITGEPIWLSGKARTSQSGRGDKVQTRITYNLTDASGQIKLSRSSGFTSSLEQKLAEKQTVTVTDISSYSESITVGKDKYTLTDYQYHRSNLDDLKPGVTYFSGNWMAKKTYTLNKQEATVIIESWGNAVGYNHAWGNTETQKIDNTITFSGQKTIDKVAHPQAWSGTYQLNLSYNTGKTLTYESNEPTQISFEGGYLETTQKEETLQYSYNLPQFDSQGLIKEGLRDKGDSSGKLVTSPTYRRLPIPFLRDVKGHWAEADILRLASLEALPIKGEYIGTRLNMTRGEFAYAIAQLANLVVEETKPPLRFNPYGGTAPQEISPFADVPITHPYYKHIKANLDKGIITGVGIGKFAPDAPLTRAQAITMMIKTLGFEGLAPMYNNNTDYKDDQRIPYWAKDAIYVGSEIGLISGENGYAHPNETMSRAEAAAFLNRFITYMQKDMRYEYRERLLNFR